MEEGSCDLFFFFSSRRRHTRCYRDWSSDVCSSDLFRGKQPHVRSRPGSPRAARLPGVPVKGETMMRAGTRFPAPGSERGVMLIEALAAILIFSIGILAVVGMQAVAIKDVTSAKYRSEAAFLAQELLAQMWTDNGNIGTYAFA